MGEHFSGGSKLEKTVGQQPETPKSAEGAGADAVSKKELQDAAAAQQKQERITAIDAQREQELGELNATRAQLGLSPSDTSVAITALDRERAVLQRQQRATGKHESGNQETVELAKLIPEIEAESRITPEIRYYFQKVLGPKETARRMQEMGPGWEPKISEIVRDGNLNKLVWAFTMFDPLLKVEAERLDKTWFNKQQALGLDAVRDNPPSFRLYQRKIFADIEDVLMMPDRSGDRRVT